MKERKGGRRYPRPKIKRPRVRLQLRVLRSESHRPFPIRASAESGSVVTRTKDESHARNEFCSLDETVLTEFRAAIELLRGGKVRRKNSQTAVAIVLSDYFSSSETTYIQKHSWQLFLLFISLFFFIFPSYVEIVVRFAVSITIESEAARIRARALQCFVTLRNAHTLSLYVAHAHLGSWLQSARRHTLNTIPGALLNAARAFISCLNGWMSTKEPGRFARISP